MVPDERALFRRLTRVGRHKPPLRISLSFSHTYSVSLFLSRITSVSVRRWCPRAQIGRPPQPPQLPFHRMARIYLHLDGPLRPFLRISRLFIRDPRLVVYLFFVFNSTTRRRSEGLVNRQSSFVLSMA